MTRLTDADHGTLRDVRAIDLDTCPPGSMVYVETDKAKGTIYITTIISAHHHGDMIHGASIMGPTPFKDSGLGPKPVMVSRFLEIGKPLRVESGAPRNLGIVTGLKVWSTYQHQLGTSLDDE